MLKDLCENIFFVAELGINHDGSADKIISLIDAAAEAKAGAVKFQLYDTDSFYNRAAAPDAHALFKTFEIPYSDFLKYKDYAESKNLAAFAAPFDTHTLHSLINDKIFPVKIASGDAATEPWINLLLDKNIPFIISTGSLDDSEIQALASKIRGSDSAMLYCVSEYPAPPEGFDLNYIKTMQSYLPEQIIGFSDHSQGIALSIGAAALGAGIIERHFTLEPHRMDLDHPVSLSGEQFFELVQGARAVKKALGGGVRIVSETEKKIKSLAGREIYANQDIESGTLITEDMIILQRPGAGIGIQDYFSVINKKTNKKISKGDSLRNI